MRGGFGAIIIAGLLVVGAVVTNGWLVWVWIGLLGVFVAWAIVKKGFRHAAPAADPGGPAVPSTSDASFEAVQQPEQSQSAPQGATTPHGR